VHACGQCAVAEQQDQHQKEAGTTNLFPVVVMRFLADDLSGKPAAEVNVSAYDRTRNKKSVILNQLILDSEPLQSTHEAAVRTVLPHRQQHPSLPTV
jgi:hypothetical protein